VFVVVFLLLLQWCCTPAEAVLYATCANGLFAVQPTNTSAYPTVITTLIPPSTCTTGQLYVDPITHIVYAQCIRPDGASSTPSVLQVSTTTNVSTVPSVDAACLSGGVGNLASVYTQNSTIFAGCDSGLYAINASNAATTLLVSGDLCPDAAYMLPLTSSSFATSCTTYSDTEDSLHVLMVQQFRNSTIAVTVLDGGDTQHGPYAAGASINVYGSIYFAASDGSRNDDIVDSAGNQMFENPCFGSITDMLFIPIGTVFSVVGFWVVACVCPDEFFQCFGVVYSAVQFGSPSQFTPWTGLVNIETEALAYDSVSQNVYASTTNGVYRFNIQDQTTMSAVNVFSSGGGNCIDVVFQTSCLFVSPVNSANAGNASLIASGVSVNIVCNNGYLHANPNFTSTSCSDGIFTQIASPCLKSCTMPGSVANGTLGSCPSTLPGNNSISCNFACNTGFTLNGTSPTCVDGVLHLNQTCTPNPCTVTAPWSGTLGSCPSSALASGHNCTVACNTGLSLIGTALTRCVAGQLTSTQACGCVYSPPTNGVIGNCTAPLAQSSSCSFGCATSYSLSSPVTTCGSVTQTCTPTPCSPVAPVNGALGSCTSTLAVASSCSFSCSSGYSLNSGSTTCALGPQLTSQACIGNACPFDISQAPNATPGNCPNPMSSGTGCSISCQPGYTLQTNVGSTTCFAGVITYQSCAANSPTSSSTGGSRVASSTGPTYVSSSTGVSSSSPPSSTGLNAASSTGVSSSLPPSSTAVNALSSTGVSSSLSPSSTGVSSSSPPSSTGSNALSSTGVSSSLSPSSTAATVRSSTAGVLSSSTGHASSTAVVRSSTASHALSSTAAAVSSSSTGAPGAISSSSSGTVISAPASSSSSSSQLSTAAILGIAAGCLVVSAGVILVVFFVRRASVAVATNYASVELRPST
jgi:hypothetical protein